MHALAEQGPHALPERGTTGRQTITLGGARTQTVHDRTQNVASGAEYTSARAAEGELVEGGGAAVVLHFLDRKFDQSSNPVRHRRKTIGPEVPGSYFQPLVENWLKSSPQNLPMFR